MTYVNKASSPLTVPWKQSCALLSKCLSCMHETISCRKSKVFWYSQSAALNVQAELSVHIELSVRQRCSFQEHVKGLRTEKLQAELEHLKQAKQGICFEIEDVQRRIKEADTEPETPGVDVPSNSKQAGSGQTPHSQMPSGFLVLETLLVHSRL